MAPEARASSMGISAQLGGLGQEHLLVGAAFDLGHLLGLDGREVA